MDYEKYICSRVASVPPSGIRKFFDIVNEIEGCITLGIGEPDFDTPQNIRDAAIRAIQGGFTQYTSNWGKTELRQKICEYLSHRIHIDYDIENVLVTTGTSEALDLAFRAIINPGDDILIPEPTYVSYMPGVIFAGGNPVALETREEDEFRITADTLKKTITKNTKAIVIPYPNNPTGAIMRKEDYEKIAELILAHDLIVISDELYGELTYEGEHFSIAQLPGFVERTIVINGFSKTYAMTGFRQGYVVAPKQLIEPMFKIHQYTMLCAPTIGQLAAYEAVRTEMESGFTQVKEMAREYNERRLIIYNGLNEIGLKCFEPLGAFYIFPNITSTGLPSGEFCEKLLQSQKVACVPGTAFGASGEGFIRCSYSVSKENIKEALSRIGQFVRTL
jgi:aminotransferase